MNVVCYGAWRASSLLWQPGPGAWALTVACHAVFELAPNESPIVAKPLPLDPVQGDDERAFVEPWGPPAPIKRHPEVIVVGHAHAPPGNKVTSLVLRLGVGELEKLLHVHGDTWFNQDGALAAPIPFDRMPLRWDRAAGAPNDSNPVGVAMGKDAVADRQGRVFLPNLRPMGTSIRTRDEVVAPVGFGPIRPTWPSRLDRLHRYAAFWDWERWAEQPLPADFDIAYFNVAPPDQVLTSFARNERILLEHLHPRFPRLVTYLDTAAPCVVASLGGVEQDVPVVCDTLVIDSDRGLAFLVWRGQVRLAHPQQDGVVFVSAARIGASATGTLEGVLSPGGAALPFQRGGAKVETLAGTSASTKPVLPFRPAPGDVPSAEITSDAEILDDDTDPPTVRGEKQPPQVPVIAPPVVAPAPPIVAAPARAALVVEPAPAPRPPSPPRPPKPALASSIERCAAVAARIAAPGADRAAVLAEEDLTPEVWEREHTRWLGDIQDELDRGNQKLLELFQQHQRILEKQLVDLETTQLVDLVFEEHRRLLVAYDTAYVAAIEEQRGPMTASEFARLSRAADRGEAAPVLAELRLPEGSINRIRRVWRAKMAKDPRLGAEVRAALQAVKP
jgi:hypothetical protein